MNTRKLGKNGFDVSEIGLGCWQLGGDWGDTISEEKAYQILQTAINNGITILDTADVYGGGRSEQLIGTFIKTIDRPIRVITKFGRTADVYPDGYTEQSLRTGIEKSLNRLGVSQLDLVQLHCIPTEVMRKGEIFAWLRKIQEEGLIKGFGASVETVEEGLICIEQEGLLSLQVIFNIFRQKLIDELFPRALAKGVGIIVRLPLASGLLTGKFNKQTTFGENDHRNYNKDGQAFNVGETFAGLPFEKGVELSEALKQKHMPESLNMVQFALRWILDHKAVSTVIPGASAPSQVVVNAMTSVLPPLSSNLHDDLRLFYKNDVHQHIRGAY